MRFEVSAGSLAAALARITGIVETRNTIPILSHVRIEAVAGNIRLTASDLDIEARTSLEAEVATAGDLTLPAVLLRQFSSKLPKGATLTVEVPPKSSTARLSSGGSKIDLHHLPSSDFPSIDTGDFPCRFELRAGDLARIAKQVGFAVSTDETRFYLNGIFLHVVDNHLVAAATDGYRFARLRLSLPKGAAELSSIIIPSKTIRELEKLASAADNEAMIAIEASDTKLRATFPSASITTRLVDGNFPDYARAVPAGTDRKTRIEVSALKTAIDRASLVLDTRNKSGVRFNFEAGNLTISGRSPTLGEASELITGIEFGEDAFTCGFNASFVESALAVFPGAFAVFDMGQPGNPSRWHEPDGAEDYLVVIMPMNA